MNYGVQNLLSERSTNSKRKLQKRLAPSTHEIHKDLSSKSKQTRITDFLERSEGTRNLDTAEETSEGGDISIAVCKEKVLFVGVCWSCLVGIIILGIIFGGNCWQETQGNIKSQYGLGSAKAVIGNLSILIGLQDVVVSLKGFIQGEATEVHMRESFSWRDAYMKDYLKNGLQRGLPDPILTVLEYLNEDHLWGAKLCFVGRLVSAGLWISLAAGLLSAILIQIEQKWLLGNCLVVTGIAMISSCIVYDISLPSVPMVIHVSGTPLMLSKGWPYFTTLCIGVFSVLTGFIIIIVVSVDNIEAPVRLFTKLCHKTAQLFHKHVPPLRTIT